MDHDQRLLEAGTYQGHEGFRHFVRKAAAAWEDLRIEPDKLIGAADQVVVPLAPVTTARPRRATRPGSATTGIANARGSPRLVPSHALGLRTG